MEKQNTKNLFTSLVAGIALMFSVVLPAQAALVQADVMGQIDSFNTAGTGDVDWTGFQGLAVGDTVQMHVVWDDTGVSGAASEAVGFESMTIDLFNAVDTSVLTFIPDNTATDAFNVLLFENGALVGMDLFTFIDDGSVNIDYDQLGGGFTIFDFASGDAVLDGSYTLPLPPGSITPVPVPAAVWLFGAGLAGLVGIARRKQV